MQHATLETAADVVAALGGPTKVGKLTSRAPQQVWNWKRANRFPGRFYLLMTRALAERGYTAVDQLWQDVPDVPSMADPPFACPSGA